MSNNIETVQLRTIALTAGQLCPGQRFKLTPTTKHWETMCNHQGNGCIIAVSSKGFTYMLGSHVIVYPA